MATRSILAEQLTEYQIPLRSDWPTASSNSSSRVDVIFAIWEILMFACLVFAGVSLYFRNTASQGSEIGPSPENPNSSSDSLKSSWNILVLRNAKGTMNLLPSEEYTMKWPLSAIDVVFVLDSGEASLLIHEILFLPKAAIFCHFLAISWSLLGVLTSIHWNLLENLFASHLEFRTAGATLHRYNKSSFRYQLYKRYKETKLLMPVLGPSCWRSEPSLKIWMLALFYAPECLKGRTRKRQMQRT
ncbi:hypothetical protein OPV22_024790 [Ensete ventricosum]|uniref:Uncharacterized protein n=1 Tax=Ensete ventricosum TaxID=4639 RepID=A0AAV8QFW0_ENSVE|nr:hypothetical protein OPV22_024790 [Ensete ventricosum]